MISLTAFGICLGIAVVLLVLLYMLLGDDLLVFFMTFSMLFASMLTGTGNARPKPLTNLLTVVFIFLPVLLLAGAVCLAYPFLSRTAELLAAAFAAWRALPRPPQTGHLLLVNHLLWLLTAALVAERVVNAVGCRWQLRATNKGVLIERYVQPLLMHALAFVVLFATRNHLLAQPQGPYAPGYFLIGVLVVYGKYLLTSLLRNLGGCLVLVYDWKTARTRVDGLAAVLAVCHATLFGYLLVRLLLGV